MKKWIVLALLSSFLTVVLHGYLSQRSYKLMAGKAGASAICNISESINCDSALTSSYAKVFNISVSNFGLSFNFFIAFVLLCFLFGMFRSQYWKTSLVYLSGLGFLASLAFMGISLIEDIYCPICWGTYAFSLITFLSLIWVFRQDFFSTSLKEYIAYSIKYRSLVWFFGSTLALALFMHIFFVTQFDIKSNSKEFKVLLMDWQFAKPVNFDVQPTLSMGPKDAKMTVVEFADFTCPSCKRIQPQFKNFLASHKDVRFDFYPYPLDRVCNESVDFKRTGLACDLALAVICSEKQNKGWQMHDEIFDKQTTFLKNYANKQKINEVIDGIAKKEDINLKALRACMNDSNTKDYLKEQTRLGARAKIRGTPSVFVNGKFILHAENLSSFLTYIYSSLK